MTARQKMLIGGTVILVLILAACATPAPAPAPIVDQVEVTREVEVTRVVPVTVEPEQPVVQAPFEALWIGSAHAKADAEAFIHWNEDDPKEVPESCAKCHTSTGYQDFIGADGSAAGTVDKPVPVGEVITCTACHNDVTKTMTSVVFPSGVEITGLGPEARCMQCHQGRASTVRVDESIAEAGLTDDDTVSADLGFTNIHYFAAAATQAGGTAMGGYQYAGKAYDAKFAHVEGFNSCVGCHDSHTLQLKIESCAECHSGVASVDDLKNIRMQGSLVDYDGDGDLEEGIYFELEGLRELLYQNMLAYANEVAGTAIAYSPAAHPYFFIDTNGNGQADDDEAISDNRYNAWTGRLAKAAYNYQTSLKDPGAFAHGGKYIIQLLYDSIESLNEKVSKPVDLATLRRIDDGHFAGSEEAFRHWDEEGQVPGSCAKCHSATGLPTFLKNGTNIAVTPANGFQCATCHDSLTEFSRYEVTQVTFPSGAVIDSGNPNTNLCINCHQGRESTTSVNRLIAGLDPDAGSEKLRFLNVHYFAAGATLFGTQAKGAYEYSGQTYLGRNAHVEPFSNCTQCHSTHRLEVQVEACGACHQGVTSAEDLRAIRMSTTDYDGDGNATEGLAQEIATYQEALYAGMQDYATNVAGTGILYSPAAYPYFFADTNGNGTADPDEVTFANSFKAWTPRLLQAAYNYQYSVKDPGAFAHNGKYILQVLYDSLKDLGTKVTVDMSKMVRPQ